MDSKLYPQGTTPHYSKYVNGVLKFFKRSDHSEFASIDGVNGVAYEANKAYTKRTRTLTAAVNTPSTLIAAVPGYKIRIVDVTMIAYGGAAGTTTTVDVLGTQSASSVKLLAVAIAGLSQSAVVRPDHTNSAVLADGASFAVCDVNTAITISKTGGALDTATGIDTSIVYELVRA